MGINFKKLTGGSLDFMLFIGMRIYTNFEVGDTFYSLNLEDKFPKFIILD